MNISDISIQMKSARDEMFGLSRSPGRIEMVSWTWSFVVCPAALIQGNHRNCTQFASSKHIDWLVRRLEGQESSKGIVRIISIYVYHACLPTYFSIHVIYWTKPMLCSHCSYVIHICWLGCYTDNTCVLPWLLGGMFL